MTTRFTIDRLGAQGDGVARTENGDVFVSYTLPGEAVTAARVKDRADLVAVLEPSALRVAPACRHFATCGGCALQHMEEAAYRDWKREKVVQALRSRRVEADVAPLIPCAEAARRRATFAVRRTEAGMLFGFNRHLSAEIVPIDECPILRPEIVEAFGKLRTLARLVCATPAPFHLAVASTASGLDIAATGGGRLGDRERRAAIEFAIREGLARLSVDGEILVESRKPTVTFGAVSVEVPPGAFLQATEAAEQAMADLVTTHLAKAKRVADLFSGCGSFALRLAGRSEVHAVENDAAALAALDRGFRFAKGLKRVTTEKRDLFRRPLTFKELNGFDSVVFDPPRAGAEDQSKQIARSEVPLVAAVSCNPVTLARDLAILLEGGYRLTGVTPIDQFLWSPHVEAVALLEKPRRRR
jgi:23S rRNA (uracil1939-C5)-methyltransferase